MKIHAASPRIYIASATEAAKVTIMPKREE
jgi:hypothetical protein